MTITIDTNFITFSDSTKMQSANWRILDGNTGHNATSYAIGTYLLIDTKHYNSRTNPIPLDGWGRYYTGPSLFATPNNAAVGVGGAVYNDFVGVLQPSAASGASGGTTLSGTWVSRGSGLSQGFVVRVA